MPFLLVVIGSGLGGMARHGVGLLSLRWFGPNFPFGALAINIVGSALMGLVVGVFAKLNLPQQSVRLFLTTGILGGFTTFSTFSLDTVALSEPAAAWPRPAICWPASWSRSPPWSRP